MKRGEIWIAAGRGDYLGQPRPVLVVQSDTFVLAESITVCPITTDPTEAPLIRILLIPRPDNGLQKPSFVMIDKIQTLRKARLSKKVGSVEADILIDVGTALSTFLNIQMRVG